MGRPAFSDASVPLAAKRAVNTLAQGSGMVSGPSCTDKTFLLVPWRYTNQNRDAVITSPVEPGRFYTGDFGQTLMLWRGLTRCWERTTGSPVRANFDRFSDTQSAGRGQRREPAQCGRVFQRNTYQAALTDTATISPSLI